MKQYFKIDYGCLSETLQVQDLDEAMQYVDERCSYTADDLKICDINNDVIAYRRWYGCMDGIELCKNPIKFGNEGFYSDWIIN